MNQVRLAARFFVYGSLTQGLVHFQKVQEFIVESMPARLQATAYRLKVGFPVVIEGGVDLVPGELLTLHAPDLLFQMLDQFHGFRDDPAKSLYRRQEVQVQTMRGSEKAWVYYLNPQFLPKTARPIEKGDWRASLEKEPLFIEQLTEKQREYILRLGACMGRETLPINLPLYRELMKLEIIVDKGRRLALSPLGHEVYRYLT